MNNVLVNDVYLTEIADAIRTQLDVTTRYKPSDMPLAIGAIASKSENHFTDLFTTYRTEPKDITASDQTTSEVLREQAFNTSLVEVSDLRQINNYLLSLRSITFPETGIDSEVIAPANMYQFFYQSPVSEINLNGLNVVNTTSMQYLCQKCSNLEAFNFGNVNLNKVTTLYGAFLACTKLTDVISVNNSLNSVALTNVSYMFQQCTSLKTIDLSFLNFANVTSWYGMFSSCSDLISVTLPNTVTDLRNGSSSANSSAMFYGCSNLKSLVLRSNVPPTLGGNCLFGTSGGYNEGMKIFVPNYCGAAYRTAPYQIDYADIIEEI